MLPMAVQPSPTRQWRSEELPGDWAASGCAQQALQCCLTGQVPEVITLLSGVPGRLFARHVGVVSAWKQKPLPEWLNRQDRDRVPLGTFWPCNGLCPLLREATAC